MSFTKLFTWYAISFTFKYEKVNKPKQYKKKAIPTGFGRVLEPLVLYVRDEIARPNIGDKHYRKFTGYLLTVFFFIWILNLLGLTPIGFNVTGQIAVTAAATLKALCSPSKGKIIF